MSKEWEYSQFVELAAANGGPRELMEKIALYGFEEGAATMKPFAIFAGIGGLLLGSASAFLGTKHFMNKKNILERTVAKEEAELAMQVLEDEICRLKTERNDYKSRYEKEAVKNDTFASKTEFVESQED